MRGLVGLRFWGAAFGLALWAALSYLSPSLVPSPVGTGWAFFRLIANGELLVDAALSSLRVLGGFVAATVLGVGIAWLSGYWPRFRALVEPTISFFRYIPPTALIAIWILFFGLDELFKIAVVFFSIVFYVVQMALDALDDVSPAYVDLALTSGFSKGEVFTGVLIPASMPRIWDALRVNFGAAWTFLVVAELIGSGRGLGHFIALSQRFLRVEDLYAGVVTFGLLGLSWDRVFEYTSRKLFRWHYVALKQT
jgi:NitT/TauT family transport system permease protein